MIVRLIGAAAGFTGAVVGGFLIGLLVAKSTGADWWTAVGLFVGMGLGIAVIVAALRPIMKSS
jgi:hypothetical protein